MKGIKIGRTVNLSYRQRLLKSEYLTYANNSTLDMKAFQQQTILEWETSSDVKVRVACTQSSTVTYISRGKITSRDFKWAYRLSIWLASSIEAVSYRRQCAEKMDICSFSVGLHDIDSTLHEPYQRPPPMSSSSWASASAGAMYSGAPAPQEGYLIPTETWKEGFDQRTRVQSLDEHSHCVTKVWMDWLCV